MNVDHIKACFRDVNSSMNNAGFIYKYMWKNIKGSVIRSAKIAAISINVNNVSSHLLFRKMNGDFCNNSGKCIKEIIKDTIHELTI